MTDWTNISFLESVINPIIAARDAVDPGISLGFIVPLAPGVDVQQARFWGGWQVAVQILAAYYEDPGNPGEPFTFASLRAAAGLSPTWRRKRPREIGNPALLTDMNGNPAMAGQKAWLVRVFEHSQSLTDYQGNPVAEGQRAFFNRNSPLLPVHYPIGASRFNGTAWGGGAPSPDCFGLYQFDGAVWQRFTGVGVGDLLDTEAAAPNAVSTDYPTEYTVTGTIHTGDYLGPWIWEEINAMVAQLETPLDP